MVRPEKVRLSLDAGAGDNGFPAVVRSIAFTGAVTTYQLVLGPTTFAASLHDTAHLAGLGPGGNAHVEWRAADALVLEADGEPG
jgi:hypothetical protein